MATTINGVLIQDQGDSTLAGSTTTPAGTSALTITRLGAYLTGSGEGSAEVLTYDKATHQLFILNNDTDRVEIIDISDPGAMTKVGEIDVSTLPNYGGMNSIAVANGVVAVAVEHDTKSEPGLVALYSTTDGSLINAVPVGALPDMLTFTPDGKKILVANEAENPGAGEVESAGTISLIDLSGGAGSATAQTLDFSALDGQEDALRAAGVRIFPGVDASIAIEPEYIAVSNDGKTAFVTLQENNAVAVLDITGTTPILQSIVPLGYIDFNLPGNEGDFSDRDGPGNDPAISINNAQIRSLPMPDAIATWDFGGVTYFATANEGDTRVDETDSARLSAVDLSDTVFGADEAVLRNADEAGRLTVSVIDGDTDPLTPGLEEVYAYGGRGFSVFRMDADGTITKVGESGGEFEDIIAALPNASTVFNGENLAGFDSRSDNKAAEPEAITVANVGGNYYAFVGLERAGGVMAYDVTDPSNLVFTTYVEPTAEDFGPEIVKYIAPVDSPTGQGLLLTANEISGSITAYLVEPETYRLQLLHFADGEAGLLASSTAHNLAALVDAFDDDYANTLILAGGDNFLPGPFLAAGTDLSVTPTLNAVSGSNIGLSSNIPIAAVDIAIHNEIGVMASTIGNHEFDLGSNAFAAAIAPGGGWVGAQFPYLSSNLDFSGDSALNPRFTDTLNGPGNPTATLVPEANTLNGRIAPSAVIVQGGEKIGLVGATTQILEAISSPSGTEVEGFPTGPGANGEVDDMDLLAAQLQPVIDELIAEGINKIILMAHLQLIGNEQLLATKLRGVDIILSAGSNTRLGDADDDAVAFPGHAANFAGDYPLQVTDLDGKTTLIVNTDNEYTYLGRLVVDFDANGDIIIDNLDDMTAINGAYASTDENVAEAWNTTVDNLDTTAFAEGTKGDQVRDLTDAVQDVISIKDGNVYGFTDVYLEGERQFVRTQETNLGNLSADANGFVAQEALGDGAFVVSLKNGGGIRAQIGTLSAPDPVDGSVDKLPPPANPDTGKPEGGVSQLDVENSLRFNNRLMVFDTTPEGLLNILNFGAGLAPGNGGFPQIGGVRFSYDPDLPGNAGTTPGSRVRDVALIDEDGNLLAVIVNDGVVVPGAPAVISAVILNFTANGGDGYPIKANGSNFRFLLNDGTLTGPVDEGLNFTASNVVPANAMGEQDAFAAYMQEFHATQESAYNKADTPMEEDTRIQNVNVRDDTVLDAAAVTGDDEDNDIVGTSANDSIDAAGGDDQVSGAEGDDTIFGGDGDDRLDGDEGDDVIDGQAGFDLLDGGDGNDSIAGGDGEDVIEGGDGNDELLGGGDDDRIFGDAGNDSISGGEGNDRVKGNAGDDDIVGDEGNDNLSGDAGNDTITGGSGNDTVLGGEGDDVFVVEGGGGGGELLALAVVDDGVDRYDGGAGIDTLDFSAAPGPIVLTLLAGASTFDGDTILNVENVYGSEQEDVLIGNNFDNELRGNGGADVLDGRGGNDTLLGGDGDDVLAGRVGNDVLGGGDGDDELVGGDGDDEMSGDAGDDALTGGDGNDTMSGGDDDDVLSAGDGNDVLDGGSGDDELSGYLGDDALTGGDGDDLLLGGAGNDTLEGGAGDDILTGGAGADQFVFNSAGDGVDTITQFALNGSAQDRIVLSASMFEGFSGDDAFDLIGGGYLRAVSGSGSTEVQVDADGGGDAFQTIAVVNVSMTNGTLADHTIVSGFLL